MVLMSWDVDVPGMAEVTPPAEVAGRRHAAVTHGQREPGELASVTHTARTHSSPLDSVVSKGEAGGVTVRGPLTVSEPGGVGFPAPQPPSLCLFCTGSFTKTHTFNF